MGRQITPNIMMSHFKSAGLSADHIQLLFNPEDAQDVKLAFDMLKDIWNIPQLQPQGSSKTPGFLETRESLWILGKMLYHMIFPYLCVDLSLSEQVKHLSAATHLAMVLYKLAGKDFIPTNLYIDLIIMVKNVLFCIAKTRVNDPDGKFWIILLGTDRLEELFSILRTMIGNDANLDVYQLVCCLVGTTEVSNILAKYPKWDCSPRQLKLPSLSRESKVIPDSADHIKLACWWENVKVKKISLQTSWNCGRHLVEQDSDTIKSTLQELVVSKSSSVWFFDHFGWILNQTGGPVQANWPNSELDLQFSSECSPVQVQRGLNHEPNSNLNNIIKIILIDIIIVQRTWQRGKSPMSHWRGGFPLCHVKQVRRNPPTLHWISQSDTMKRIPPMSHRKSLSDMAKGETPSPRWKC